MVSSLLALPMSNPAAAPLATHVDPALLARPRFEAHRPPPVRHIVIAGGGSAGWMTALLLADALVPLGVQITVVESPTVGIIGVGEGSTPWLRGYFEGLGIEEAEWMPACHATYKCGISFEGWSTKSGFERYFHPFASMLDNLSMTQFVHKVHARLNGADLHAHPDRYFIAARLAQHQYAPQPTENFPFDISYGYHFDAVLIGQFLQKKAMALGVRHHSAHITHATRNAQGGIAAVHTREGLTLQGDFYIDCTGFAALLIEQTLGSPYRSYASNLFNDAAVALPTPMGPKIASQTVSTAMKHGWAWQIPLTQRHGNGYVYSSAHCTADQAEFELRHQLGLLDSAEPARHLKMRVGRVEQHWHHNCLAVGLSQGFIEPLEATALLFVQRTASRFLEVLSQGDLGPAARAAFNAQINAHFEGTRDYIVTHYKTNSRTDTDYWRANTANPHLSENLQRLYAIWLAGKAIAPEIREGRLGHGYPIVSWYCLMAGMGIFPDTAQLRPPTPREGRYSVQAVDHFLDRCLLNFGDHATRLRDIRPRSTAESLQLYFW